MKLFTLLEGCLRECESSLSLCDTVYVREKVFGETQRSVVAVGNVERNEHSVQGWDGTTCISSPCWNVLFVLQKQCLNVCAH